MSELPLFHTVISGKIRRFNNSEGFYYTTVVCPAADPYSLPPIIKIRSKKRLGMANDEISEVVCRISGYERAFNYTDKQTGQPNKGYNVDMFLELSE